MKKALPLLMILFFVFNRIWAQNAGSFVLESGTFSNRVLPDGITPTNTYHIMTDSKFNSSNFLEFKLRNTASNQVDMNFRILLPVAYFAPENATKQYPMIVMMHGAGESGISWGSTRTYAPNDLRYLNNDHQLIHGGKEHLEARNLASTNPSSARAYDGIYLVAQNKAGWFESEIETLLNIVELVIQNYRVDKLRIYTHGLSNGGQGACVIARKRPDLFAAYLHMSAFNPEFKDYSKLVRLPSWQFQGGQDNAPTPNMSQIGVDRLAQMGGNHRYTLYPNIGHGTWEDAYDEPDFYSWILSKNKKYVHVFYGRTTFCTPTFPAVKIAVSQGYGYYQWYKNGEAIQGENKDSLMVTSYGNYNVVFKRNKIVYNPLRTNLGLDQDSVISNVVSFTPAVSTPKPTILFNNTYCFTGLDGASSVTLSGPAGKSKYQWLLNGNPIAGANAINYTTSVLGSYTLKVTDLNQCESDASEPVELNSGNPNAQGVPVAKAGSPVTASSFNATNIAINAIGLTWADNANNELGYELYRSNNSSGPYQIIAILPANTASYNDINLLPNKVFFYRLRAFNNSGASIYTPEIKASTISDLIAPTSPELSHLANKSYPNSLSISWTASTDNIGIDKYRVSYFTGSNAATQLEFPANVLTATINGLTANQLYNFTISAIDLAGNVSIPSNQVSGFTKQTGVDFEFFEGGTWNVVADYNNWPASQRGRLSNFNINKIENNPAGIRPNNRNDYFAYNFTGYIYITNPGLYTFGLSSDDGSLLFINETKVVDYDGLHGAGGPVTGQISLTTGAHTIKVRFFERTGGEALNVTYKGPDVVGTALVKIPDLVLVSSLANLPTVPNAPSLNVPSASISNGSVLVNLSWTNNTANTQVEVYRRPTNVGAYQKIFTTAVNASSFTDNAVDASTAYQYLLKAINSNGSSSNSNVRAITTPASAGALNAPSTLAVAQQGQFLKLTWADNSSNESGFQIERSSLSASGPYFLLYTTPFNTVQYTDNSVLAGQTYFYRIRAINTGNQSAYSNIASAVAPTVPNNPTDLTVKVLYSQGVELRWKDNADNERGFKIERSTTSGSGFVSIADSLQRDSIDISSGKYVTFRDQTLTAGQTYYYRLRAFRGAGFSDYTTEIEVKMPQWMSFVNFGKNGTSIGGPLSNFNYRWNNLDNDQAPSKTNIVDDQNIGTSINLSTLSGFGWRNSSGFTTTNNIGILPDEMMQSLLFYDDATVPKLRLSNLSTTKLYKLQTFSSQVQAWNENKTTTITITNTSNVTTETNNSVNLSHLNNRSNLAEISGINTNNGILEFEISKGPSSLNAVLNAMVLYCYELPAKTFFAQNTNNLNLTNAWGVNTNGTGSNPLSFATARQTFRLQPNHTYTLASSINISGVDSKLVLDSLVTLIVPDGVSLNAKVELKNGSKIVFHSTAISTEFLSIHSNSIIEFAQSSLFNIPTFVLPYGNLNLSGLGAKVFAANTNIEGVLNISCPIGAVNNAQLNLKESVLFNSVPDMPSGTQAISFNFIGQGTQYIQTFGNKVYLKNLSIANGSTTIQSPPDQASLLGAGSLDIFGNITCNGNFVPSTGTLYFSGNNLQTITGNLNLYNMTVENSSVQGLVIANSVGTSVLLNNTLLLEQNAKFSSNDKLTFVSNESGTARLAKVSSGAVFNGKINLQRFIGPSKAQGFYLIGTPLKNQTLLDWNDDVKIQIPEAWGGNPNTSRWDVNTRRWITYNSNQAVNPGQGVRLYIFGSQFNAGNVTIDNLGEPNIGDGAGNVNGDFLIPLQKSSLTGWNMVANPYPCEIDFEISAGWDKTNINNSFYVWDPIASNYRAYVASGGTNLSSGSTMGVSSKIGSGQAFMVIANNAGNLGINENAKSSNFPVFYREKLSSTDLRVELKDLHSDAKDEALIRFNDLYSSEFEPAVDALKLEGEYLNLSIKEGNHDLTIDTRQKPQINDVITLSTTFSNASNYQFRFSELPQLDSLKIYLLDYQTLQQTEIHEGDTYSFDQSISQSNMLQQRFKLAFKKSSQNDFTAFMGFKLLQVQPNPAIDKTSIQYSSSIKGEVWLSISNNLGLEVERRLLYSNIGLNVIELENLSNLPSGVYHASIRQNNEVSSTKIILNK
jgi:predicted esterase/fibronectin type 3 domain-containing protein